MTELTSLVKKLSDKVNLLIEKLNSSQSELSLIKEENLHLNSKLEIKSKEVKNLNMEIINLKLEIEEGKKDNSNSENVRMRIDDMVKEIDECIALIKE